MGELKELLEKLRREKPPAFENADYGVRITHTVDTDMRIMSFVDTLWDFEVTGGKDQFEPLTIVSVRKRKLPKDCTKGGRSNDAGMRVNDTILAINDTPADDLTLMEACELIRESGRHVRIYVRGDGYSDPEAAEYTVNMWYRIPPRTHPWKWEGSFPWNDKGCKVLRESNCFQVPSKIANKFKDKFEKPPTSRFFKPKPVDSIWNRKWQAKESDCIVESFETCTLSLPKARTPAA